MRIDLTNGSITKKLIAFSLPLMAGNVFQQLYNIVDTLVVGRFIGENALAAVGSAYSLMVFLTSVLCGLCMGSGACFAVYCGQKREDRLRRGIWVSFLGILGMTVLLTVLVYLLMGPIIAYLRIPDAVCSMFRGYLIIIYIGLPATFLYNYCANLLRALGNSLTPLIFLAVSSVTNVVLDLFFILCLHTGVEGAAVATVLAQYLSGIGCGIYCLHSCRSLLPRRKDRHWDREIFRQILSQSSMTCLQQSVMNFGILTVQGLVNSFGTVIMAAFTAGVKIDTVAYSPAQDFGNAFSTFVAQNYGAEQPDRIQKGIRSAVTLVSVFCVTISILVFVLSSRLMGIFVDSSSAEVISAGAGYLRIEGACYIGIGILFLLYGYYRGINRPAISLVLTVISLGTRVLLAYVLSAVPSIGVTGIWAAIPIGWALADFTGIAYGVHLYRRERKSAGRGLL